MSVGAVGAMALGIIAASMFGKTSQSPDTSYQSAAMRDAAASAPAPVTAPEIDPQGATAQAMNDAAEKEKEKALLRQQQNSDILTSGLGASGIASLQKSQLLGA